MFFRRKFPIDQYLEGLFVRALREPFDLRGIDEHGFLDADDWRLLEDGLLRPFIFATFLKLFQERIARGQIPIGQEDFNRRFTHAYALSCLEAGYSREETRSMLDSLAVTLDDYGDAMGGIPERQYSPDRGSMALALRLIEKFRDALASEGRRVGEKNVVVGQIAKHHLENAETVVAEVVGRYKLVAN